uniref:Uncharacterized protein n=1 Tax=viral metagenome TaxID=1070528 RepID=A0A6C0H2T0_9ZZZZ
MNTDVIIPYCIWHYIDLETNTFLGYISGPRKYKKDGVIGFDCKKEETKYSKWFLAGTFYAVSPSFRPIPVGMKIFCAKKNIESPYNTSDMYLMHDPYNIKEDCVYFTTYNQPVPNTSPLYFHLNGKNVFPSFDSKPPSSWSPSPISPVFVMMSKYENFKCINRRCIPWTSDIPLLYDVDPHKELYPLENCVIFCNGLTVSKNKGKPLNILEMVKEEEKSNSKIITIIIFLVFIAITVIIYNKIGFNRK